MIDPNEDDPPNGIAGTDMSQDELRATRYARIRKTLAGAPLTNAGYIAAQQTLILCDILDEIAAMRDELNHYATEAYVTRTAAKPGLKMGGK